MTTLVGATSTHDNTLREVEHDYQHDGYEVVVKPRGGQLPPFLARFEPDLIATKGHESVVVAVKTRADLRSSADLIALAGVVEAQPGWRLDLSVTPPEHVSVVDEDAESLDRDEILARATTALTLSQGQQDEAALLLAWSAAEAALRVYAAREQVPLESDQPVDVVTILYSLGLLDRDDYDVLRRGLRASTIVAHGFRLPQPERRLAAELVSKARDLLHASTNSGVVR